MKYQSFLASVILVLLLFTFGYSADTVYVEKEIKTVYVKKEPPKLKIEKKLPVSCTIRPVTQVADVAVNKASTKFKPSPLFVEIGRVSKNVPIKIVIKNVAIKSCAGFMPSKLIKRSDTFVRLQNLSNLIASLKTIASPALCTP